MLEDLGVVHVGQGTHDMPEPEEPGPEVRAWQVGYSDLGTFAMIGTSQKSVAGVIMHLKSKFMGDEITLVPIPVLALNGEEGTTWVHPAYITGVFNETVKPSKATEAVMPPGLAAALKASMAQLDAEAVDEPSAPALTVIPGGLKVVTSDPVGEEEDDGNAA